MVSKKLPAVVAVSALMVGLLVAPSAVQAQRGGGGGRGGGGNGAGAGMGRGVANGRPAVAPQAVPGRQWSGNQWSGNQWSHNHNHFVGRPFFKPFVRPFFPFAPSVVYAAPYYYPPYYDYPPPYYDPPQTYYAPPPTYYAPAPTTYYGPPGGTVSVAPAPPAGPPPDNVIQYSNGRYELRGDGVSTPYRWVWIPNPPPPPPAAPAPPGDPSSGVPSNGDSAFGAQAPPRQSQLYRWTDTAGVVHWTDRIDMVPEKYRAGARQNPPS
jgi:hypothetical protein